MQSDYLNQKKERAQFAELPQPGKVSKTKVKTDNVYLSELESYTEELGEHLLKIQNEEIEKNRRFTETLKALDKEQNSQAKEEEERKRYAADIAKLRELRKFYRERMYDAVEDKKNLLESARLQKIQEERIRRQLADLDLLPEGKSTATNRTITIFDTASLLLIIFQIVLGVLFGLLTDFTNEYAMERLWGSASRIASNYEFFIHISLFLFVGIGLLMSWMRRAGFSGIGYTFLISAFTLQWALLVMQFASQSGSSVNEQNFQWHNVDLSIDNLIEGLYGAISVVIGMGAIIGIANPVTLLWYAVMQIPFYALNYFIGHYLLFAQDLGGSIFVFTFGAFFGVSFGYIYNARRIVLDAKELSSYHSELFAFLGTVFLFVLFPSYNAAFAPDGTQHRVAINTVLSLCASVVFAFIFSRVFRGGHFRMSDVQRATIAGGIAMASISSFLIAPGGAIVTGAVAGAVVCLAVVHITPSLERRGLHDTFGVLPTWGVSGLIGALTGIISAGIATSKDSIFGQSMETIFPDRGTAQAGWNVIALIITLAIAIVGGLICGGVAKFFDSVVFGKAGATRVQFSDEQDWVVPQDFELTSFKDESKTEGTRQ